ncbi:MAG TPA: RDD family protein [Solirubrobacteraceae bacterium]|nr:RDD family protein [Solirubrobacteraceae bacterium]
MTATQQPDPFDPAAPSTGPSGPRAGFWIRFGAYILDSIIIVAVSLPFSFIDPALYYVVALAGGIAYYVLLEGGPRGQTVGKMACGIRVIDLGRGGPIGYGRAFIRYVGRIVSGIAILLGYLWMLWDKEKQTWHDKFADAVVVPTSSYPVG